jgi:dienelactone hydrolase
MTNNILCVCAPVVLALVGFAFDTTRVPVSVTKTAEPAPTKLTLIDPARNRSIPIVLYSPMGNAKPRPLAIVSPAHGGTNTAYSFMADALTAKGYLVASIQHDLPDDPPLPTSGNIYEARMPQWKAGEANIVLVIKELSRRGLTLKHQVVLIGHSHGGDITMLMADDHPAQVASAISLDNRRFPLPRTRSPRICSIRSTDQVADPGVLPSAQKAKEFGMQIVQGKNLMHKDMWNGATDPQKAQILQVVLDCL